MSSELIQEFEEQGGFYAATGHSEYTAWLERELIETRKPINKLQHYAIERGFDFGGWDCVGDAIMYNIDCIRENGVLGKAASTIGGRHE